MEPLELPSNLWLRLWVAIRNRRASPDWRTRCFTACWIRLLLKVFKILLWAEKYLQQHSRCHARLHTPSNIDVIIPHPAHRGHRTMQTVPHKVCQFQGLISWVIFSKNPSSTHVLVINRYVATSTLTYVCGCGRRSYSTCALWYCTYIHYWRVILSLILLTWRIWWASNNASRRDLTSRLKG